MTSEALSYPLPDGRGSVTEPRALASGLLSYPLPGGRGSVTEPRALASGLLLIFCFAVSTCACGRQQDQRTLTVAAAANLNPAFDEIGRAFTRGSGVRVVNSYASTAQLAQQIESGAPFDIFAAADTEHVDQLIVSGKLLRETRSIYARGKLVLWVPKPDAVPIRNLLDLTRDDVRFIAVANPAVAPYGKAAVQTLRSAGLWEKLQPKVAYAANINMAREYAASGNAEAAFTAYSLVIDAGGRTVEIDAATHDPLDQAMAIVSATKKMEIARRFVEFVTKGEGVAVLRRYGYEVSQAVTPSAR